MPLKKMCPIVWRHNTTYHTLIFCECNNVNLKTCGFSEDQTQKMRDFCSHVDEITLRLWKKKLSRTECLFCHILTIGENVVIYIQNNGSKFITKTKGSKFQFTTLSFTSLSLSRWRPVPSLYQESTSALMQDATNWRLVIRMCFGDGTDHTLIEGTCL